MEYTVKRLLCLALLTCSLAMAIPFDATAEQAPAPIDSVELDKEYDKLLWQDAAQSYELPHSHSHLALAEGFAILLGADAERYAFLANGIELPQTEAVLSDLSTNSTTYIDHYDDGFVGDSDWSDIDAADFLKQMQENELASNDERVANGHEASEVIGWIEEPSYDSTTHVAHYVVEMSNAHFHWVNAVAIKLGRSGYHQITWAGDLDQFKTDGPRILKTALDSHSYDTGHKYADFKDGDKTAAYGLAGLMAAVAGVKLGKGLLAGIFAFIAIAGKKLIILLVPLAAGVFAAVKRFIRRS